MNKRFTFTKLVVCIVCVLFIGTLIFCLQQNTDSYEEITLYATALTVTGSILLTTVIFYAKKSSLENVQKIKISYYESTMDIRLKYNKEMLKLRKKYGVDEDVIEEIEMDSDFDEVVDDAFYEGAQVIQDSIDEIQESIEKQEVETC